jgi:hypothetical protein
MVRRSPFHLKLKYYLYVHDNKNQRNESFLSEMEPKVGTSVSVLVSLEVGGQGGPSYTFSLLYCTLKFTVSSSIRSSSSSIWSPWTIRHSVRPVLARKFTNMA